MVLVHGACRIGVWTCGSHHDKSVESALQVQPKEDCQTSYEPPSILAVPLALLLLALLWFYSLNFLNATKIKLITYIRVEVKC